MTDQRKEVINQLHELNILILHTKLKATRAQTALRAATRVRNVEAARRGVAPLQQLPKSSGMATHMLECLNEEELSSQRTSATYHRQHRHQTPRRRVRGTT